MKKFLIFIIICIVVGVVGINVGAVGKIVGRMVDKSLVKSASAAEVPISTDNKSTTVDLPEIYIKAVNPGYTDGGKSNVGEMIEIGRNLSKISSDTSISLAGYSISYTNSSGNISTIVDLSKYLWLAGETVVFRLASAPDSALANLQYSKTLAVKAGPLSLVKNGEVVDSVCWTGVKNGCYKAFDGDNPTTLVRDLETGEFRHVSNYTPGYIEGNLVSEENTVNDEKVETASQCKGVEFSEILSYYESLQSEQFIELYNAGTETVLLDGCQIKYKNKYYPLSGMISTEGYFVRNMNDFKLTKNPTTSNTLELIDTNGDVLDKLEYPNGQRKGTSYALIGYDEKGAEIWKVTYLPTPGEANVYQEFRTCEEGKVINETTGNCVKATSIMEKICGEGKYLNILTGRCKSYETTTTTECKEGYYRNEETGRCRKIQDNTGADYALVPETYSEQSSFTALYLVLGVVGVGSIYIIYEFRHEIGRFVRKVFRR